MSSDQPTEWNSDTRRTFARQVQASMLVFNDDMARAGSRQKVTSANLDLWRRFRDGWSRWYGSAGMLTWSFDSTVVTISAYANQLQFWREKYVQWTGLSPTGVGPVAAELDWTPVYWVAAGAAVVGVGYVYWNSSKGRMVRSQATTYAKSRLGLGDVEFDFSHMERTPRRRRRPLGEWDHDSSQVFSRADTGMRQRFEVVLQKAAFAIDDRAPFLASRHLRDAEHLARTAAPGLRRAWLTEVDRAKRELAKLATASNDATLAIRGEGLEGTPDKHAARSHSALSRAKQALDRGDFEGSAKSLKAASTALGRVRSGARQQELAEAVGMGRLLLKRERQYRPTREMHELGDIALIDDKLHFDELEIGAEDPEDGAQEPKGDAQEPDEDDERDEASSMMTVPTPWVPTPWTFKGSGGTGSSK